MAQNVVPANKHSSMMFNLVNNFDASCPSD